MFLRDHKRLTPEEIAEAYQRANLPVPNIAAVKATIPPAPASSTASARAPAAYQPPTFRNKEVRCSLSSRPMPDVTAPYEDVQAPLRASEPDGGPIFASSASVFLRDLRPQDTRARRVHICIPRCQGCRTVCHIPRRLTLCRRNLPRRLPRRLPRPASAGKRSLSLPLPPLPSAPVLRTLHACGLLSSPP